MSLPFAIKLGNHCQVSLRSTSQRPALRCREIPHCVRNDIVLQRPRGLGRAAPEKKPFSYEGLGAQAPEKKPLFPTGFWGRSPRKNLFPKSNKRWYSLIRETSR